MPSDWQPYVLGHDLDVTTRRDSDGDIKQIDVEVQYNERRWWTEGEYEDLAKWKQKRVHWDDAEDPPAEYIERSNGASATFRFKPDDGRIRLSSMTDVETGNDDRIDMRVFRLVSAARLPVSELPDVDAEDIEPIEHTMQDHISFGADVEILE